MDTGTTSLRELTDHDLDAVNGGAGNHVEASLEYLIGLGSKLSQQDHQDQLALMQGMQDKLKRATASSSAQLIGCSANTQHHKAARH
jgi:hypothetical protein